MILLDVLVLGLVCFFSLFVGIFLSGIFGEEAPALLRIVLGFMGLFIPPVLVWSLRKHIYWNRIRLGIITLLVSMIVIRCATLKPGNISKVSSSQEIPQKSERASRDPDVSYKSKTVKLIPFSGAVSYPKSKPNERIEAANRQRFIEVFKTEEILITYECGFNKRGLYSDSSLTSVSPAKWHSLISAEFENSTGSLFNSDLCASDSASTNLRSLGVSVSIVNQS